MRCPESPCSASTALHCCRYSHVTVHNAGTLAHDHSADHVSRFSFYLLGLFFAALIGVELLLQT